MIDLIFKIINLLTLTLVGLYIFKKFVLPVIQNLFNQYHSFINDLKKKHLKLEASKLEIQQKSITQAAFCEKLKHKVDLWKSNTDNLMKQKSQEQEFLAFKLQEKIDKQSEIYKYQKIKHKITPKLINKLKEELTEYFKDKEHIDQYFSNILKNK